MSSFTYKVNKIITADTGSETLEIYIVRAAARILINKFNVRPNIAYAISSGSQGIITSNITIEQATDKEIKAANDYSEWLAKILYDNLENFGIETITETTANNIGQLLKQYYKRTFL